MSVSSSSSSDSSEPGSTPTVRFANKLGVGASDPSASLIGWYLDKPAELRVCEPFLVVRASNAELVFPLAEFRFEAIGPSPTRRGAQQLIFVGEFANVIFESAFADGWERFIEIVRPEVVVTPETQSEAPEAAPTEPEASEPDVGLEGWGVLSLVPPPPTGPRLDVPSPSPTPEEAPFSDAAHHESATQQEPAKQKLVQHELDQEKSDELDRYVDDWGFDSDAYADSIARRDLQLVDLEADDLEGSDSDPAELDGLTGGTAFAPLRLVQPDETAEPIETVQPVNVPEPIARVEQGVASNPWYGRFVGPEADDRWLTEVVPVIATPVLISVRLLQIVIAAVMGLRAIAALSDPDSTVVEALFSASSFVVLASLAMTALSMIGLAMRGKSYEFFTMQAPLVVRLARGSRLVGMAAIALSVLVILMLVVQLIVPSESTANLISWSEVGWAFVAAAAGLGLSAIGAARVRELDAELVPGRSGDGTSQDEIHDEEVAR